MKIKTLVPHIIAFGIIFFLLYGAIWGNMMLTNNQGEFGYPEQGIYDWGAILPTLFIWLIIFFCIFELPIILYQATRPDSNTIKKWTVAATIFCLISGISSVVYFLNLFIKNNNQYEYSNILGFLIPMIFLAVPILIIVAIPLFSFLYLLSYLYKRFSKRK